MGEWGAWGRGAIGEWGAWEGGAMGEHVASNVYGEITK